MAKRRKGRDPKEAREAARKGAARFFNSLYARGDERGKRPGVEMRPPSEGEAIQPYQGER